MPNNTTIDCPNNNCCLTKGRKLAKKITFRGLEISIENEKNSVRHWIDVGTGRAGETKLKFDYGYFCNFKMGMDGDQLDCFVGPVEDAENVYVVNQMKAPDFKKLDELKVMLGFESYRQAKNAYEMHYDNPDYFGSMDTFTFEEFTSKYMKKSFGESQSISSNQVLLPPPPTVEDLNGVMQFLAQIGNMNDKKLNNLAGEIWGPSYSLASVIVSPGQLKAEIVGFLLDQRDFFQNQAQSMTTNTPQNTINSQNSSALSQESTLVPEKEGSSGTSLETKESATPI